MKKIILLLITIIIFSCENDLEKNIPINYKSKKENSVLERGVKEKSTYDYKSYCNKRFSFCLEYPENFKPLGEAGNRDGQQFLSQDGKARITAWGNLVEEDLNTLEENFNQDTQNANITYKKKGADYYVVSGIEANKVFYQKTFQRTIDYYGNPNTEILISYRFTYPIEQKEQYDSYCNKINSDLN